MNSHYQQEYCDFCKIRDNPEQQNRPLLFCNAEYFAFHDMDKSSAKEHVLVCPKQHIDNALEVPHTKMLFQMREIGVLVLNGLCEENKHEKQYRFGFHLPPHTSIDHVHLHCFVLPLTSWMKNKIVYGKGLASIEDVCKRLEKHPKARL